LTNNYKELLLINEEKETLLKEIHHRVKNNLQLISSIIYIRMTGMPNSLTKSFLSETRQKINSIALIHETLLQQTESTKEVDIDNYLSKLMSDMQVAYASDHAAVNLSIDIDPIMVSIDVAINCSMIVTELFANSIKHADKAHITECNIGLSLHKKSHGIEFVMSDNGPGIPDDIRPGKHNSFGMKLLDVFFKQLEAEVIIEGTKGTVYRLLFKL
jgi:two-component sensor histidine kinase